MALKVYLEIIKLRLPTTKKMVAITLADLAYPDGTIKQGSSDRVGAIAGCSWRTAFDMIGELVKDGIVDVVARPPKGSKRPITYQFNMARVAQLITDDPITWSPHERKKKTDNQGDAASSVANKRTRKQRHDGAVKPHRQLKSTAHDSCNTPQITVAAASPIPVSNPVKSPETEPKTRAHARDGGAVDGKALDHEVELVRAILQRNGRPSA